MPMTPEMGPDRRQQYLKAQGQSSEDRIRQLMEAMGGAAKGVASAVQVMPYINPTGPIPMPAAEDMPWKRSAPTPAEDRPYQTMPRKIYRPTGIAPEGTIPRRNTNLRAETPEERARRKGRENGIE